MGVETNTALGPNLCVRLVEQRQDVWNKNYVKSIYNHPNNKIFLNFWPAERANHFFNQSRRRMLN
jgi:hypothetical protein